ncbi:hypothetical protein ABI214_25225 [Prescottella soli]|uniref:DUF6630 domain-containing protein n=2 Tax=Prescottella soli TaxID=1543852 RepID=A0ABW9FU90_9NOCA
MSDMAYFLAPAEPGFVLDADDADDVVDSLIQDGVLLSVDWSGEEWPGQISQFVAGRVEAFGKDRAVVAAAESAAREAAGADLERGEHVPAILRAVDDALARAGLALGELRCGDDTYRVGVMRRTAESSLAWGLDRPSPDLLFRQVSRQRHTDQLKIAAVCFAGALINAALVPVALLIFAIVPPLGVILLAITTALAPVLLCTSIGFLVCWALLTRNTKAL